MRRNKWNSYPLIASPLYKLKSKRKLAELLGTDVAVLKKITKRDNNYLRFTIDQGTPKQRPIQAPHPWLRVIHVRILDLLRRIHPPAFLKSGVKGESIVTNAAAHVANNRGFKFDIKKFYPNVSRAHIFDCFYNTFEMAPDVADLLTDLCEVDGHLPTGSSLSADLAFFANFKMFEKLAEIAREEGLEMTVWVDDITVTGFAASRQICNKMISIVKSHGYECHKNVFFKPGCAYEVTGVVIHEGQLLVPHRRHKKLHTRLRELDAASNESEYETVVESVIGLMESSDQIQRRHDVRKKALRKELKAVIDRRNPS